MSGPYVTRSAHHSPMYGWKKKGKDARLILEQILPLMGERRREKIQEVLNASTR